MTTPPTPATDTPPRGATPSRDSQQTPPRGGDLLRVPRALLVLAALFLEVLPVAVLLAVNAGGGPNPQPASLSLWAIAGIVGAGYAVGTLSQHIVGTETTTLAAVRGVAPRVERHAERHAERRPSLGRRVVPALVLLVGYAVTVGLALLLSPVAYGGLAPAAALAAFTRDATVTGNHAGALFGLPVLLAYLWWRGLTLRREQLTQPVISRRFLIGLGAVILAIILVAANPGPESADLEAMLALALPFEVFCGLFGTALAHAFDAEFARRGRRGQGGTSAAQGFSRPWLLTTLAISGGMVLAAIIASLFVSTRGLHALLALLAPIGNAINVLLTWVTYGIAYVLFFVFGGLIQALFNAVNQHSKQPPGLSIPQVCPTPSVPAATSASAVSRACGKTPPAAANIPQGWLTVTQWLLIIIAVIVVAVLLVRALRFYTRVSRAQGFEEERTALDGRALLAQQLRDLFRRRPRETVSEEALLPGSVRALYRDLLRAAARAGYQRHPSETPGEYARRLATLAGTELPLPALDALTSAYYATRYGAPAAEPVVVATPDVRDAFGAVTRWLATHPAAADTPQPTPARPGTRG